MHVSGWRAVLKPGDLVLGAVSGGADSTFLAHFLATEAARDGWNLHLAHVNHGLRGAESDADAEAVLALAEELAVPCTVLDAREETAAADAEDGREAAWRRIRLDKLECLASSIGAVALATGHHRDDLAETFLLMALRGSGPDGLGGLREVLELPGDGLPRWVLRPLLAATGEQIRDELRRRGVAWREDATNASAEFTRNWLRAEVLPALAEREPGAAAALAQAARHCAEQSAALRALADARLAALGAVEAPGGVVLLPTAGWREEPPEARAELLRAAWRRVAAVADPLAAAPPRRQILGDMLQRLGDLAGDPSVFETAGPVVAHATNRWILLRPAAMPAETAWRLALGRAMDLIFLADAARVVPVLNSTQRVTPGAYEVLLPAEADGALHARVLLRADFQPDYAAEDFASHRAAAFDARSLLRDLELRAVRPDDKLPLGPGQSKAGDEALQEAGVPPDARDRVAALCDGRGVLWIPGVRRARTAFVTDRTELVLVVRWQRGD